MIAGVDVVMVVRAGDRLLAPLLDTVTQLAGARPVVVHTSSEAELALRSVNRDLVVLDPDVAPIGVLRDDAEGRAAVVCWLTTGSSARVAQLLDAGADDVVDASMAPVELSARLRRALQGRSPAVAAQPAVLGGLRVDARLREASWQGNALPLTPREAQVLQVLVAAGGRPVSREVVYRQVWRWAMPRGDRTVDVNVKRLRDKLAAAGVPVEIVTQPGVGYRINVEATAPVVTGL